MTRPTELSVHETPTATIHPRLRAAARTIQEIASDAGVTAFVHATRLEPTTPDTPGSDGHEKHMRCPATASPCRADDIELNADEVTPIASLYKLPLALCWADQVSAETLDPQAPLVLPAATRAPGATGVACLADPVTLSQRDAVRLMLAASDNACSEALLESVGLEPLSAWLTDHHLHHTHVRIGSADSLRTVIQDTGGMDLRDALHRLADPTRDQHTSQYDSALASSSTPRELTSMLRWAWTSAPTDRYAWIRTSMMLQHWQNRIRSGFPHDDVVVAGKTGTLGRLRHEAGVVTFPHEHPVAVAVLTSSARPETHQPRVDTAIGAIARTAVNVLRAPLA